MNTDKHIAGLCALGGGSLSWILGVWGSAGTVGWFDAPELAAAGQQLGIAHAPGEPAYLLLVRLAQLLPVGDLASRPAWLAASCAAVLVAAVVWLARMLVPSVTPLGLVFVAATSALCAPLWIQGVVVELYGLQALVLFLALLAVCHGKGAVHGYTLAGALLGLAGAINPLLTVLALPGALIVAIARHGRPSVTSLAAGTAAAVAVGISCYLYLPLRSAADPAVCFAVLDEPAELLGFMSGSPYARSFGPQGPAGLMGNVAEHVGLLLVWCGLPALLLGALGVVVWVKNGAVMAAGLLLFGLASWLTTATRPTLETFTPDVAGYLLGSCLVVIMVGAAAVGWIQRRSTTVSAVIVVVAVAWTGVVGWTQTRVHRGDAAQRSALALLESTPPGGMLLLGSDSSALPVLYATTAARRRPDLFVAPMYLLEPQLLRRQASKHSRLVLPSSSESAEWLGRSLMASNQHLGIVGTPLLWPPEILPRLVPVGLGAAVAREGEGAGLLEIDARLRAELVDPLWSGRELDRARQLRRLLTSSASNRAGLQLRGGDGPGALETLLSASSLHPDPWAMVHLQRASVENGSLAPPLVRRGAAAEGRSALAAGDTRAAVVLLERAVEEYPEDADLREELAAARFWERDFAGASADWDRSLALRPASPLALAGKERLYAMGVE